MSAEKMQKKNHQSKNFFQNSSIGDFFPEKWQTLI